MQKAFSSENNWKHTQTQKVTSETDGVTKEQNLVLPSLVRSLTLQRLMINSGDNEAICSGQESKDEEDRQEHGKQRRKEGPSLPMGWKDGALIRQLIGYLSRPSLGSYKAPARRSDNGVCVSEEEQQDVSSLPCKHPKPA